MAEKEYVYMTPQTLCEAIGNGLRESGCYTEESSKLISYHVVDWLFGKATVAMSQKPPLQLRDFLKKLPLGIENGGCQ